MQCAHGYTRSRAAQLEVPPPLRFENRTFPQKASERIARIERNRERNSKATDWAGTSKCTASRSLGAFGPVLGELNGGRDIRALFKIEFNLARDSIALIFRYIIRSDRIIQFYHLCYNSPGWKTKFVLARNVWVSAL